MRAFMADAFAGLEGHDPEAEALAAVRNATPRFSPPPSKADPASPGRRRMTFKARIDGIKTLKRPCAI